jgi:hypothetical protein
MAHAVLILGGGFGDAAGVPDPARSSGGTEWSEAGGDEVAGGARVDLYH